MVIKSLSLEENELISFDTFSSGVNLIFSEENTKGKTSFLRLLFYSLGYPIPSMKGLDFSTIATKVVFEEKGHLFCAERRFNNLIILKKDDLPGKSFSLPSQHVEFLGEIFEYTKIGVLNNLLGFIYVDQEKGWTLLNRGTVIGRIKFSIEELLSSLKDIDITELLEQKKILEDDKKKFKALLDLQTLKEQAIERTGQTILLNDFDKDFEQKIIGMISGLHLEINNIKKSIKEIDDAIQNEEKFKEYIDSMMLRIDVSGQEDGVLVTRNNIIGLNDNYGFLNARKVLLSIQLEKKTSLLKKYKAQLLEERGKKYSNSVFENAENPYFAIDSQILNFNDINQESVNDALEKTSSKLKEVNKKIKDRVKTNNDFIDKIYQYVLLFVDELNIKNGFSSEKNYIFTTDLKSISGAVLQKIVIAFKVAFLKVVEEAMETKLFMVLDSPKSKELDEINTRLLMKLINEHLSANQIFIASIYDSYKFDKKITLVNRAIEKREEDTL